MKNSCSSVYKYSIESVNDTSIWYFSAVSRTEKLNAILRVDKGESVSGVLQQRRSRVTTKYRSQGKYSKKNTLYRCAILHLYHQIFAHIASSTGGIMATTTSAQATT